MPGMNRGIVLVALLVLALLAPTPARAALPKMTAAEQSPRCVGGKTTAVTRLHNTSARPVHVTVTVRRPRMLLQRFHALAPGERRRVRAKAARGVVVRIKVAQHRHHGTANGGEVRARVEFRGRRC